MGLCTQNVPCIQCICVNARAKGRQAPFEATAGRCSAGWLPPRAAKHPAAWDVLQLVWCSTVDAAACTIDAISSMLAGRQVLCSSGLGSLQQPAAGRAHFGVQRQQELRKRRCASCRAQYDAGWASSSLDAQVMLHNLRLAADCSVDGEAEIRHSCPMQTLSKRAALLQYAETVEPSLIETFSEQVCACRIASPTAGASSHGNCGPVLTWHRPLYSAVVVDNLYPLS